MTLDTSAAAIETIRETVAESKQYWAANGGDVPYILARYFVHSDTLLAALAEREEQNASLRQELAAAKADREATFLAGLDEANSLRRQLAAHDACLTQVREGMPEVERKQLRDELDRTRSSLTHVRHTWHDTEAQLSASNAAGEELRRPVVQSEYDSFSCDDGNCLSQQCTRCAVDPNGDDPKAYEGTGFFAPAKIRTELSALAKGEDEQVESTEESWSEHCRQIKADPERFSSANPTMVINYLISALDRCMAELPRLQDQLSASNAACAEMREALQAMHEEYMNNNGKPKSPLHLTNRVADLLAAQPKQHEQSHE